MTCGDTEVAIWEALWKVHAGHPCWLSYDVLVVPHHWFSAATPATDANAAHLAGTWANGLSRSSP